MRHQIGRAVLALLIGLALAPWRPARPGDDDHRVVGHAGHPSASSVQHGRLTTNGVASSCASPKSAPAVTLPNSSFLYTAINQNNYDDTSVCLTYTLTPTCSPAQGLYSSAYLGSFNANNPAENYLADSRHAVLRPGQLQRDRPHGLWSWVIAGPAACTSFDYAVTSPVPVAHIPAIDQRHRGAGDAADRRTGVWPDTSGARLLLPLAALRRGRQQLRPGGGRVRADVHAQYCRRGTHAEGPGDQHLLRRQRNGHEHGLQRGAHQPAGAQVHPGHELGSIDHPRGDAAAGLPGRRPDRRYVAAVPGHLQRRHAQPRVRLDQRQPAVRR